MAKIRWSHEAERWLRDIYDHIVQSNSSAAEKVVSGIYEKAQLLSVYQSLVTNTAKSRKEIFEFSFMDITESPILLLVTTLIYWAYFMEQWI